MVMKRLRLTALFVLLALGGAGHTSRAQGNCSLYCRLFTREVLASTKIEGTDMVIPGSVVDMPGNAKVSLVFGKDTLNTKENLNLEDFVFDNLERGEYSLVIKAGNSASRELFFNLSAGRNALLVDLKDNTLGLKGATFEEDVFTYDAVDFGLQMKSPTLVLLATLPRAKVENKKLIIHIEDIGTTLMEGALLFSLDELH